MLCTRVSNHEWMLKTSPQEIQKKAWHIARMVHWKLCEKYNLEKSEKWYLHNLLSLKMSATN